MTISVFPSLMPGEPIERHEWTGTFAAWLESKGIDYKSHEQQPISVTVNGEALAVDKWGEVELGADDAIEIRPLPHGGVFKGLGNILGKIFNAVFGWLMPSQRGGRDYQSPAQGRQLETSEGKANQAKLGDVVPELAGRFRRFPDYLTPPRRYFSNPREQWLEFHACIGPGNYQINAADVKVGETPFSALGADGRYQIFPPGENLAGVSTHEHWHTVDEVGGTSSGTAGLELSTELANRTNSSPASYTFDGNTITRSDGVFPTGWGNGTIISVSVTRTLVYAVTLIDNPFPLPDINVFTGNFAHLSPLADGSIINVSGAVSGTFEVRSVSLDSAGNGSLQMWTLGEPPTEEDPDGTDPSPVNNVSPGNHTLTMVKPRQLTVSTVDDGALEVLGGNYLPFTAPGAIAFAGGTVYGEWTSEFVATPGNETTSTLEFDFFFPGGLAYINDEGGLQNRSVGVEFQHRNIDGGPRVTVQRTYTMRTLDQIGFTERVNLSGARVACRARRVGASSTSTQVQDTIHWYGLKCRLPTRTSYPNWTTMSIQLRSGGRIAAQSENQINVVATRVLPALQSDGTWGSPVPTSDISAFLRYIAHTIGYTDDNLDMEEMQRLHAIWTARGETMDHVIDQTTVKEAMNMVLGAGMAELTIADGLIRPVRDEPRTQFEAGQAYSPQNMLGPLKRTFRARRHDDPDGVEVEYTDGETWTQQTVICALPGSQRLKLEKVRLRGVTDRTRAWRIGMRRVRQQRYRNWDYSFDTEMDALNSEYLSYVPLLDDIPGYGQSALLEHVTPAGDGVILRVTEPIRWEEGQSHVVAYRRSDGTLAGPWAATPGPDEFAIIASIPEADRPKVSLKMELPHVYVGTAERWCFPALITEISPRGADRVSVSAVNYSADVYADDDNAPTE